MDIKTADIIPKERISVLVSKKLKNQLTENANKDGDLLSNHIRKILAIDVERRKRESAMLRA